MNTVQEQKDVSSWKEAAKKQWNTTPCGTGSYLDQLQPESLEWFDEIRRSRYEDTDPWMKRSIDFSVARGKKLLEIGHGIGTDLLEFARNGAEVSGIDITERHHRLATLNFQLHQKKATLKLCDSANIDFPTNYFDVVYSHGVLHHTPDTVRCISEAYRVLKPGGTLILSLYHTWSAFHLCNKLVLDGLIKGNLRRLGYKGLMATLERGADGIQIKPLVKTYSKSRLKHILGDFSAVDFTVAHLEKSHLLPGRLTFLMPQMLVSAAESRLGWYVIAKCTK